MLDVKPELKGNEEILASSLSLSREIDGCDTKNKPEAEAVGSETPMVSFGTNPAATNETGPWLMCLSERGGANN